MVFGSEVTNPRMYVSVSGRVRDVKGEDGRCILADVSEVGKRQHNDVSFPLAVGWSKNHKWIVICVLFGRYIRSIST